MFEVVQFTPISSNMVFSKSQNPSNLGGVPRFGDKNRAIWRLAKNNPLPYLLKIHVISEQRRSTSHNCYERYPGYWMKSNLWISKNQIGNLAKVEFCSTSIHFLQGLIHLVLFLLQQQSQCHDSSFRCLI